MAALFDGLNTEPQTIARYALPILAGAGKRPRRDDQFIDDDEEAIAFLAERIAIVMAEQTPLWKSLAVF